MADKCNMKGFLEFQVLALIGKNNISGNGIRNEIAKRRGCKPSPGTIYPVLKELQNKNFIVIKGKSHKEIKYTLTLKGKKELNLNKKLFKAMFNGIL